MINVALLSKWHVHAVDYAKQAQESEHITVKTVWDEDHRRGKEWADELGVAFDGDLSQVLNDSEIDAVIVAAPTNQHKEIMMAAAEHKKHIFTEKVLAMNVQDCEEIYSAAEKADIELTVSLPRLTEDYYLYAQNVIDNGTLGTITMMRCRLAHNGAVPGENHPKGWLPEQFFNEEQCGGGALIDLGAHPIYLANRLLGKPAAVTGRLKEMMNRGVDDHSAVLVEYESGVLAVLETSFVSAGSPFQLEVYGTEGTLLIEDDHIRMRSSHSDSNEWAAPDELPASLPMPMEQWVTAIEQGKQPKITKEDVVQLTLINQAAALSHKEGRRVTLSELM